MASSHLSKSAILLISSILIYERLDTKFASSSHLELNRTDTTTWCQRTHNEVCELKARTSYSAPIMVAPNFTFGRPETFVNHFLNYSRR